MNKFHENFARLLKKNKARQTNIAKAIGVTQSTVSKYNTGGKEPTLDRVIAISRFFDVSLDELILGKQPVSDQESLQDPLTRQLVNKITKLSFPEKVELHKYMCNKYP